MRITGGEWRGRELNAPQGLEARPTQDRVRAAFFNMLGGNLAGAEFLDLFAGSGAVGFEALSRGAVSATFVEVSPRHIACVGANASALKAVAKVRTAQADAWAWPAASGANRRFAFAWADPPYALAAERGWAQLLSDLAEKNVVASGGIFAAEMGYRQDAEAHPLWELCRDRVYGQTRLAVYRRLS